MLGRLIGMLRSGHEAFSDGSSIRPSTRESIAYVRADGRVMDIERYPEGRGWVVYLSCWQPPYADEMISGEQIANIRGKLGRYFARRGMSVRIDRASIKALGEETE